MEKNAALGGANGSTPAGSERWEVIRSVGGGQKKRALAQGYSINTPPEFSTALASKMTRWQTQSRVAYCPNCFRYKLMIAWS